MLRAVFATVALYVLSSTGASAQAPEIAPGGKLRTGMIAVHVVSEVAKPIGKFIADKLGTAYEPIVYPTPPAYAQSFGKGEWDIGIGSRVFATPETADLLTDIYLIELLYVVAPGVAVTKADDIDKPGVKVGTVQGSPSDRFLTRAIKTAEIVRIPLGPNVSAASIQLMRDGKMHVFGVDAGIGYQVTAELAGSKVLPDAFETVPIALAVPKGKSPTAHAELVKIVREAKDTGVVQRAIDASGLKGLRVAPN